MTRQTINEVDRVVSADYMSSRPTTFLHFLFHDVKFSTFNTHHGLIIYSRGLTERVLLAPQSDLAHYGRRLSQIVRETNLS